MKIRVLTIPALVVVLSSCLAKTLTVGSGPGDTREGGTPGLTEAGTLGCTPGDCSSYSFTCTSGSPKNVQCVVDTSAEFPSPICTLTGECVAEAMPTCAWTPTPCSGSGPCSAPFGGAGLVSVEVDPAGTTGPSATVLTAYFNHAQYIGGQTFGDCVYNANSGDPGQSGVSGAPAPRPGIITASAPGFTVSISPACDGTYAPGTSSTTMAPGALVGFAFTEQGAAGSGDGFPTSLPSVPAPHPITLGAADALAAASPTVVRATDLAVDWTVTGTPLALEHVVVLMTQGTKQVTCTFDAGGGSGVVPADALLELGAASASYAVYSVHEADLGMGSTGGWDVRFLVQTAAATATGLAKGTLTLD